MESESLQEMCACCKTPLRDPAIPGSIMDKIFAWQFHLGRCGGDGRRLQADDLVKRALKEMILSIPNSGGAAFPASKILIESPHLRGDEPRLGDFMALGKDVQMLDTTMDIVIASGLTKSCVSSSCKSSDFVLKAAEKAKFVKDRKSVNPISSSRTMRFVPLALNHFGMRGPHFQAVLKEFATILVLTKPVGCSLLQGPFSLTHTRALHTILRTRGSRLTWTTQREHASQLVRDMQPFYERVGFVISLGDRGHPWEGG